MAMFKYSTGLFMSFAMYLDRCAICSCMYMKNVRLDHHPCFMMVVSEWLCSFSDIAPPALKEWMPTKLGSIPLIVVS
eukprot:6960938-Ditylum_brightwellii.AAC.1